MPEYNPVPKIHNSKNSGVYIFMDGQNDDDYMFSGRDLSSFGLHIRAAGGEAQKQGVIDWFHTSKKYVVGHHPDLAREVMDLPDKPPSC
ncbi:hypothetical protein [Streptomyces sp. Agncl-13]|uniref:hypothetical protein n=1 Tax=Streptomyces sp. Agncl-13 TaxID=3400628 RepID=UPI003A85EBFC